MSTELAVFDSLKADITLFVAPLANIPAITSAEEAQRVVEAVRTVKAHLKKLGETADELLDPLKERVKFITAYVKDMKDPLQSVEASAKLKIAAWEDSQERLRQIERRKEQERMAEIQRQADAERERIEREVQAKALAEREKFEEANVAASLFGDDETDVEGERLAMENRLAREAAEQRVRLDREEAVAASESKARQYDINATKVSNSKRRWKAELIDIDKVPRAYLKMELNNAACVAAARGGITVIPGVRLYQETEIAIGATTRIKALV